MSATEWNQQMETRHSAIDEQHREMFSVYADALEGARGGDAPAAQAAVLKLLELTRRHFAFEEQLMSESSYSHREVHAKAHAVFMRDLLDLVAHVGRDASSPVVRLWLESRYVTWWKLHVRSNDAALANYLATLAVPPPTEPRVDPGALEKVPA